MPKPLIEQLEVLARDKGYSFSLMFDPALDPENGSQPWTLDVRDDYDQHPEQRLMAMGTTVQETVSQGIAWLQGAIPIRAKIFDDD